jgi:hypothetical protein
MLNTDSQILKFINDLQQNESKFFNGSFLGENEEDYIKAVEIINYNINKKVGCNYPTFFIIYSVLLFTSIMSMKNDFS